MKLIETTVHLEQVNSMNKTKWPTFRLDKRLLFFEENNSKII